jgi:UDP-GlcNAc:undecaprenyl-phosphate/decaprenyl-phosphate GlcNAc-1-phosphate transferase
VTVNVPAVGRIAAGLAGAAMARAGARRFIPADPPAPSAGPSWWRTNHRGEPVTLLEGPLLAAGAVAGLLVVPGLSARARLAALGAVSVAAGVGAYDDRADLLTAEVDASKGFRGHLAALRAGRVTSGSVKLAGLGVTGLVAGTLLRDDGWAQRLAAGAVIAGSANLLNLLDLRPGRALKVGLLAGGHLVTRPGASGALVAGGVGAAAALLPLDLSEQAMLGDCGANALGALLGAGIAASAKPGVLYAVLALVVALTAVSERVSFTDVIDSTPGLREVDRLGRRPE